MRRAIRLLGTLLIVGGVGVLLWTVVVWRWQDPFTGMYTRYEQHKLVKRYDKKVEAYQKLETLRAPRYASATSLVDARRNVAEAARRYRLASHEGDPIGRIIVKRLGLNMILVNGTDEGTLEKGPGRDLVSYMPGEGQLVYIAGHRTTYLAPFSHIDHLRAGDVVTLSMPYGTFIYRITYHIIVPSDDMAVLRSHGKEILALQACHPRFFATHRYIAYARLVRFELPGGRGFTIA